MRILIIKVSAIGDVVHTLPSLFYLKQSVPNSKISWIVQEKISPLLKDQDFIENLLVIPNRFWKFKNIPKTLSVIKQARKYKWDAILDFQGLTKTSLLINLLRGKKFGFDWESAKEGPTTLFTKHHVKPVYKNIVQKNLALASLVASSLNKNLQYCPSIEEIKKEFHLSIPEDKQETVDSFLNTDEKFVVFSPNTTWDSKHWPTINWQRLLLKINNKAKAFIIGRNFGEQAKELCEYIEGNKLDIKIVPDWDLLTIAYLIKKSELLVAPDTGILHLGDFIGTKTIGIFGPTLSYKHGPFLYQENIKNSIQIDCPHLYKKSHDNLDCMSKLTAEELFNKIFAIMG